MIVSRLPHLRTAMSPLRTLPGRLLLAAPFLFAACKGTEQPPAAVAGPADIGGTIVISTPADATTMNPLLVAGLTDRQVTDMLYDHLAEIGQDLNTIGDGGFIPQLALRWDWAKDSLSIAFHLNPNAKWHDGAPVRASDVRYSLKLVKDTAMGSPALPLVANVDSISVRDSLTAVAFFHKRVPEEFYDLVYQVAIVPEHVLSNTPVAQLRTADVGRRGIGSGRFRLAKWEPGSRIELVADTANYRGRPRLDRVVYMLSPDAAGALARFMSGEADIYENIPPNQVGALSADSARRLYRFPLLQYTYFVFNERDPKAPGAPHPIFGDLAVRRALTMATDRRAMLKNVFDTLGKPLYGPFPKALLVADTLLPQIPYDTAKARALLDSAGWLMQPDGVRAKAGKRLAFTISTPSSSTFRHAYAVLLQESFRKVGADVKLDESDFAGYMAKLGTHKFDTEMGNFSTDPSVSGLKQSWTSSGMGPDGSNYYSYANPVADAYLDSATNAFDLARQKSYSRHAFETIINDAPAIWLYEPPTIVGVSKRIHVTKLRADQYFSGMSDWWIPAGERTARDKIGLRPTP